MPKIPNLRTITRKLHEAEASNRSVRATLESECPNLAEHIGRMRDCPDLVGMWGQCVNFDENAKARIIEPGVLAASSALSGVQVRNPTNPRILHAGLAHTYGYLFSSLVTPYGYKRERWVDPTIERGFGIRSGMLRALPTKGTLFSNVTWFAGRLAFRGHRARLRTLAKNVAGVADDVTGYDYESLAIRRISERVVLERESGTSREVELVTDLVRFPNPPEEKDAESELLVYSLCLGRTGSPRLITMFPVTRTYSDGLVEAARGEGLVRLRYNAYVPGMYGVEMTGTRSVELNSIAKP